MATSIFEEDDMIFNKTGGVIQSAGFKIDSILMQKGEPALITRNNGPQTGGGNVADLFKDLAVPAGLAHFNKKWIGGYSQQPIFQDSDKIINEDIYDKLLKMVEVDGGSKPKKTRRAAYNSKKGTKKMRSDVK